MKLERLFHVLVVMGGATAAGGCDADADRLDRRGPDAGPPPPDAGPTTDAALVCFCNQELCCDRTVEPATLVPGFECCWSTTCP